MYQPIAQFLYPPPIVDNLPASQQTIVPDKIPVIKSNVPPDVLCPRPPPIVAPNEQHSLNGDWITFPLPPPINDILAFVVFPVPPKTAE